MAWVGAAPSADRLLGRLGPARFIWVWELSGPISLLGLPLVPGRASCSPHATVTSTPSPPRAAARDGFRLDGQRGAGSEMERALLTRNVPLGSGWTVGTTALWSSSDLRTPSFPLDLEAELHLTGSAVQPLDLEAELHLLDRCHCGCTASSLPSSG